jgi:hypothetical protein
MKKKQKKKISLSLSFMTNSRHVDSEKKKSANGMQACVEREREDYACILKSYLISH